MGRRLWPVELALRFDKEEAEALWQLFEPIDAKCVATSTRHDIFTTDLRSSV